MQSGAKIKALDTITAARVSIYWMKLEITYIRFWPFPYLCMNNIKQNI